MEAIELWTIRGELQYCKFNSQRMENDQLPLLILSLLAGIFISQWLSALHQVQEALSGDKTLTVRIASNIARVLDREGSLLGTIDMGGLSENLVIKKYNGKCIMVEAEAVSLARTVRHTISSEYWYGGPQYYYAHWPSSNVDVLYQKYSSDDLLQRPLKFGSILERYWISSSGLAVYVPSDSVDFSYGVENGDIVLGSDRRTHYLVCHYGHGVKETHMYMISEFISKPSAMPDEKMLTYPIWSTWAKYKIYINQSVVIDFANEIQDHRFPASQIEIDDTYTTNYGDHVFDSQRFPDPRSMISTVKKLGNRVTSWVHPFVNYDSKAFQVRYLLLTFLPPPRVSILITEMIQRP